MRTKNFNRKMATITKGAQTVWETLTKGGNSLVKSQLTNAPRRGLRLLSHLEKGGTRLANWVAEGNETIQKQNSLKKWLQNGYIGGMGWFLRFNTKLLDLMGIGELIDFYWQLIKMNTRPLTPTEISEAYRVFADSIPYQQVRIDENSPMAHLATRFNGKNTAVSIFYTIHFPVPLSTAPGNWQMAWLIHELTHIAQMEHQGIEYFPEAWDAQMFGQGYNYNGPDNLAAKSLRDFNREQQGDIARDYYQGILYGPIDSHNYHITPEHQPLYEPLIEQLRRGEL